jgi:hypothetical protein
LALALALGGGSAWSYPDLPPPHTSGAPGQSTCAKAGCHNSFAVNSGPGAVALQGLPASGYDPNKVYDLVVTLQQTGQRAWGFQASTLGSPGASMDSKIVGAFALTDATNTQLDPDLGSAIVEQTDKGTYEGTANGPVTWHFQWQAPPAGTGSATIYLAGNACDADGTAAGDYVYTVSYPVAEATAPPAVKLGDVDGNGTVGISDVVLLLRAVAGLATLTPDQQKAGDVAPAGTGGAPPGDGKVTISDVVRLLRFVAGLEPTLS